MQGKSHTRDGNNKDTIPDMVEQDHCELFYHNRLWSIQITQATRKILEPLIKVKLDAFSTLTSKLEHQQISSCKKQICTWTSILRQKITFERHCLLIEFVHSNANTFKYKCTKNTVWEQHIDTNGSTKARKRRKEGGWLMGNFHRIFHG